LGFQDGTPSGRSFRIALGSVAPVPIRAKLAEQFLAENRESTDVLAEAAQLAMSAARPISDVRGGAAYQRAMVKTLALRCLRDVQAQLTEVV
jgi:carbon-monoxide dehydrogenase medium subunit